MQGSHCWWEPCSQQWHERPEPLTTSLKAAYSLRAICAACLTNSTDPALSASSGTSSASRPPGQLLVELVTIYTRPSPSQHASCWTLLQDGASGKPALGRLPEQQHSIAHALRRVSDGGHPRKPGQASERGIAFLSFLGYNSSVPQDPVTSQHPWHSQDGPARAV